MIDEDTPTEALRDRLVAIQKGLEISSTNKFEIVSMSGCSLDTPLGLKAIREKVQEIEPVLIILDSWSKLLRVTDENKANDVKKVLPHLDLLQAVCGSTILIVHHMKKDAARTADKT